MNKEEALKILKNNPVFWSRLGFCYDPPMADENGEPLVFTKDFSEQLRIHDDFSDCGVKIHTCILHNGWVGVDKYDYSLCDRVLESIFRSGKVQYFIPRIKLNVPIDWCRENPTEVCLYENGPRDIEEIRSLVGTLKHDYLGYNSPRGYYNANGWQDTRPNVGGVISNQSFSSLKWLYDAGVALKKLITRLENSKYSDKILAYHICYGACGESMLWGRASNKFGDYGITNQHRFAEWAAEKYGSIENARIAWGADNDSLIPHPHLREKIINCSSDFYKEDAADRWSIDYDNFMGDVNVNALAHFGKIVKECSCDKPVGAFYGYIMYMERTAYSGHLAFQKLLECPYIDFFAAPKSYYRSGPGEPGGEMAPAVSVNRKKLWVDECDNRTHLTVGDTNNNASTPSETYAVHLRELCKNITHDSGLWYMDLGGGWFDEEGIMRNINSLMNASEKIRRMSHKSIARVAVIIDEKSVMMTYPSVIRNVEELLRNIQLTGTAVDVLFSFDIGNADFSETDCAILITPLCADNDYISVLRNKLPVNAKIMLCGKTHYDCDFELIDSGNTELPEFYISDNGKIKALLRDAEGNVICAQNSCGVIMLSKYSVSVGELRSILEYSGVSFMAPKGCAVYADSRVVSFFPKEDITFVPDISYLGKDFTDLVTGEKYNVGTPITVEAKSARAFINNSCPCCDD